MPGPTLVCTAGLPRSGKSTWAKEQGHPIVNPDAIRLAIHGQSFIASAEPLVWATAKIMVTALFKAGHEVVILDATSATRKRRADWKCDDWRTWFKPFLATEEECIQRAVFGRRSDLVPVINRMAAQWEPLQPDDLIWP
jgi:predicted kinase